MSVTFLKISHKLQHQLERYFILGKPMKHRFQWCIVLTEILSTYYQVEYTSVQQIRHWNPLKPMGAKTPQNCPISLQHVDPHLKHQCLGWPYSPSQMTAQLVHTLLHNYTTKSPWLQWNITNSPPKLPLPLQWSPTIFNTTIPWPTPLTIPNGIRIHSAILPPYTFWPTHTGQ